ncbi:MAG TPA: F0F1 ATP synthase subunit A [Mycobacteriales bacterium]|nr:F0F1 ATP synthase subunit A [Mycobacteriales bacterium]
MTGTPRASTGIEIGHHITRDIGGFIFNVDTIWATALAGLVLVGAGVYLRRRATAGVPSGLQLFFETVTQAVERQVESTMGLRTAPWVVPLAVTLFSFILIANWLALIPSGHSPEYLAPPTSDVNLAYALALLVIVSVHATGIRKQGFRNAYKHLAQPYWWLFPINLIEELARPITLSLRLFGNIFSGVIMVSLIALFPAAILWAPNVGWKLFDMFIGLIQAFIFALLTILYFSFATAHADEGGH